MNEQKIEVIKKYFTREGYEVSLGPDVTFSKNGDTGFYYKNEVCHKCGGYGGADYWKFTGWTCYRCNASTRQNKEGKFLDPTSPRKVMIYSEEKLAKLREAGVKREIKKADNQAAADAMVYETFKDILDLVEYIIPFSGYSANFLESVKGTIYKTQFLSEKQECCIIRQADKVFADLREAAKPKKDQVFIGKIGERMTKTLTVIKNISFESRFGYMAISIMKDSEGNCVMYKGSSPLCEGVSAEVTFTVKSHDIYKEKNQTVISRMKVK